MLWGAAGSAASGCCITEGAGPGLDGPGRIVAGCAGCALAASGKVGIGCAGGTDCIGGPCGGAGIRCVGGTDESGIGVSALGRSGNGIRGGPGRLSVPPLLSTGRKGRGTVGTRALSAAITRRNSATAAASPMVTKPPAIATAPATSSADPKVVSRIGTPKPTTNTPHAVARRPRIRMRLNIPLCHRSGPAARNSARALRKTAYRSGTFAESNRSTSYYRLLSGSWP